MAQLFRKPRKCAGTASVCPISFSHFCPYEFWALRLLYAFNLEEKDGRRHRFWHCVSHAGILLVMVAQAAILLFNSVIMVEAIQRDEQDIIYVIVAMTLANARPILVYITLFKRHPEFLRIFRELLKTLNLEYGIPLEQIKRQVGRWDLWLFLTFALFYVLGFVSHLLLHFVEAPQGNPLRDKTLNLTSLLVLPYPDLALTVSQCFSMHSFMLELLIVGNITVVCLVIRRVFQALQEVFQPDQQQSYLRAGQSPSVAGFDSKHKQLCVFVVSANSLFTSFLTTSVFCEIFTICFWSRGLAIRYSDAQNPYHHLWLLHFLVVSVLTFTLMCWSVSSVNEQCHCVIGEQGIPVKRNSMNQLAPSKEEPVPFGMPTSFRYYCRVLFWMFRFYGINMSTAPTTRCDLACFTILLAMNLFLLAILGFHMHILINAFNEKEYIALYAIIPVTLAIIRPIVAYVSLLRRRNKVTKFFEATVRMLLFEHESVPGALRYQVRKWELTLVTIFMACYASGLITHIVTYIASMGINDPFHQKFSNLTQIEIDRSILFAVYCISAHAFMLELVTISAFVIVCLLLTKIFNRLQAMVRSQKQEDDPQISNGKEFWKLHRRICSLIEDANVIFTPFLTTSFFIQIFTICFWTRGLALSSPWMTVYYHLWILHFLILSMLSFALLCWSASSVNQQVYLSLRALDDHEDFSYPDPNYATIKHLFYITNLNINPIQITFWNSFAINKSFVLTVIGTILTYTVALFGLN